jgi:hypothetical protein
MFCLVITDELCLYRQQIFDKEANVFTTSSNTSTMPVCFGHSEWLLTSAYKHCHALLALTVHHFFPSKQGLEY